MLRVLRVAPCGDGTVAFDGYVPFMFRSGAGVLAGPALWRSGDMETSLIEFKADSESGVVAAVTLVTYSGPVVSVPLFSLGGLPCENGVPVIDLTDFPKEVFPHNRIDEPGPIEVSLHGHLLEIRCDGGLIPQRLVRCGEVVFVIDSNGAIIGIVVSHLTTAQVAAVMESLSLCV